MIALAVSEVFFSNEFQAYTLESRPAEAPPDPRSHFGHALALGVLLRLQSVPPLEVEQR